MGYWRTGQLSVCKKADQCNHKGSGQAKIEISGRNIKQVNHTEEKKMEC